MSSAVSQTPQTPGSTAPQQDDQLLNLLAWVEIHRRQLMGGMVVAIALIGAVYLWRHFKSEREDAANAALLALRAKPGQADTEPKASDFLKVAEQHASTTAGQRARLLAAGAFFAESRYSEAQAEFERVLSAAGSGPLGAQAAYGIAASLDAQDKSDAAAAKYQEIIARHPDESVAGQARLALARLQETRKQPEAALRLLDEVLRDKQPGPFSQMAEQQRQELMRRHPELVGGAATNAAPAK